MIFLSVVGAYVVRTSSLNDKLLSNRIYIFLIYCVYLLEMALKDSIVALCPYHSHLPGF